MKRLFNIKYPSGPIWTDVGAQWSLENPSARSGNNLTLASSKGYTSIKLAQGIPGGLKCILSRYMIGVSTVDTFIGQNEYSFGIIGDGNKIIAVSFLNRGDGTSNYTEQITSMPIPIEIELTNTGGSLGFGQIKYYYGTSRTLFFTTNRESGLLYINCEAVVDGSDTGISNIQQYGFTL